MQRLPPRVGRHLDLGRLRQRHVRPPAGARRGRGPHRGRAHPRPSRPLRRHLRAARVPALRHRAREPARVRARGARAATCCHSSSDFGNVFDWRAVGDGDTEKVGDIALKFSRTDHPPPTYAVEARADGRRLIYTADTGPGWTVGAFDPGADLVLSEATYLHANRPAPIHLSAKQAGEAAREARAQRLILTHLWPMNDHDGDRDRRCRSLRWAGHHRHAESRRRHLMTGSLMGIRRDGREPDELRPITFTRDFTEFAAGSVLVEFGRTRVLCTASVEERIPGWLRGQGRGWVTAEYSMLPGSTSERNDREAARGPPVRVARRRSSASSAGRCARSPTCGRWARCRSPSTATCSKPTAERAPRRSAAATSRSHDACSRLVAAKKMGAHPITDTCGAISVGIVDALAVPRSRLLRRRARRGRHERRDDRRGPIRRSAGNRGGQAVLAERARRPDRTWRRSGIIEIFDVQREMLSVPPEPRRQ